MSDTARTILERLIAATHKDTATLDDDDNDGINARSPDGDDYNRLVGMIVLAEQQLMAVPHDVPKGWDKVEGGAKSADDWLADASVVEQLAETLALADIMADIVVEEIERQPKLSGLYAAMQKYQRAAGRLAALLARIPNKD